MRKDDDLPPVPPFPIKQNGELENDLSVDFGTPSHWEQKTSEAVTFGFGGSPQACSSSCSNFYIGEATSDAATQTEGLDQEEIEPSHYHLATLDYEHYLQDKRVEIETLIHECCLYLMMCAQEAETEREGNDESVYLNSLTPEEAAAEYYLSDEVLDEYTNLLNQHLHVGTSFPFNSLD